MAKHVVARVGEIAPGTCKIVTIRNREVGVFNIEGEYFALLNRCPHQGAPLCRGDVVSQLASSMPGEYRLEAQSAIIRCPWHCWEFDIRTGRSWCEPDFVRARRFAAAVESGAEARDHEVVAAETFPVEVERDYVVVEM
jgi:3-phenylpropionate/trans-cinnamate dioxygenase ferredoxin subunit